MTQTVLEFLPQKKVDVAAETWPLEAGKGIDDVWEAGKQGEIQEVEGVELLKLCRAWLKSSGAPEQPALDAWILVKEAEAEGDYTLTPELADAFVTLGGQGFSTQFKWREKASLKKEFDALMKGAEKRGKAAAENEDDPNKPIHLEEVLKKFDFVRSPVGDIYARMGTELVSVDSGKFLGTVAKDLKERTRAYWAADAIKKGLLAMEGEELPEEEAPVRIARHDGAIYIDLANKHGEVISISRQGCRLVTECPVGFVRSKVMKPLPRPMFPATKDVPMILESYRALLGVEGQNWHSCLAWLLSALGATGTYSILLAKGEKGAGKSTRTKFLRRMIDPRRPEMTALPKDEENMAVQAQTCHVLAWDNLSYLPKVMSDAICRLASGDGLEKRGLYTNKDLCVLEATRPCILNGISDVAKEPDILERSLICTFRKVANRKSEKVLNRKFEDILIGVNYSCR